MKINTNSPALSDIEIRNLLIHKVNDIQLKIADTESILEDLENQLLKAEMALDAYSEDEPIIKKPTRPTSAEIKANSKLTLAERVERVFIKLQKPLTASEIVKALNEYLPAKKTVENSSFSPQWSGIYRDPKRPFAKAEFPDNPNETKYYYGLKDWFEGDGVLKEEYASRID